MAKLNIGGKKVTVSDDFLRMTPEQQNAAVEEIAAQIGTEQPQSAYDAAATDAGTPIQGMPQPFANSRPITPRNAQPAQGSPDLMGATAATLGGLVQGIPVLGPMVQNTSDALVGAGAQIMGGDYGQTVEGLRARREELAAANPISSIGGQLLGGIGSLGALGATANGAQALGMTGGMGARIANSAASGAALSAGDAAFKGGSVNDMLTSGAYGGAIGAAVPVVGGALGTAARAIGNKFAPTINAALKPGQEASRRLGTAYSRDAAANPASVIAANDEAVARSAGVPLMNADRGGETVRALTRSVANQSPEARGVIAKAADERFETQGLRAIDMIKRVTGNNADDVAMQDQLRSLAKVTNKPRYDAAYNAPTARAIWTPEIAQLMQAMPFRSAINAAEDTARNSAAVSGIKAVKNPFVFNADGSITLRTMPDGSRALPSLQFWDIVQRNLRNAAEVADRGGDRLLASQIRDMRNQLLGTLDTAVPQFQMARQGAASFFGAEDALDAGRKFATQPRAIPEAQKAYTKFTDPERTAFATGYASELIDRIRSTRDRVNVINQLFGSQASREMNEIVFGAARARELEAYVRVENLADMIRGALGNSTTARQLMELGIGGGAGFALSGDFTGALTGAALAKGGRWAGQKIDAQVMEHLARLLTSRNPADLQKAISNAALSPTWMQAIEALEQSLGVTARGATIPQAVGQ